MKIKKQYIIILLNLYIACQLIYNSFYTLGSRDVYFDILIPGLFLLGFIIWNLKMNTISKTNIIIVGLFELSLLYWFEIGHHGGHGVLIFRLIQLIIPAFISSLIALLYFIKREKNKNKKFLLGGIFALQSLPICLVLIQMLAWMIT